MSLLELDRVTAFYGATQALFGVSLDLAEGEVMALMGRNGMGKTTTIKAICRMLPLRSGTIRFGGADITALPSYRAARMGLGLVPEGRRCFANLSVHENLIAAARPGHWDVARVTGLFPRLAEREGQIAASLSGGEQQMCAIGRALMSRPETILLDEPSMGLAPQLVEQIFEIVKSVNENEGVTFLLAEQNTNVALRFAHYGYILESGRVVMDGPAAALRENPDVKEFYLGMSDEGRKSFRDVRSYRRRKRWLS